MSEYNQHDHGQSIRSYLSKDLASTHRQDPNQGIPLSAAHASGLRKDGYVILERVLSPEQVDLVNVSIESLFDKPGRSGIEGYKTRRIYNVLTKTRACDDLVDHPLILSLLSESLAANALLSQLQGISVEPGERAQPIHTDDLIYPPVVPRKSQSAATIIALDDFTEENGATILFPGSHLWDSRDPTESDTRHAAVMPAGSIIFALGSLWHGAGPNQTAIRRRAISAQYCQPWLRTQENLGMATPRKIVRDLSPPLQQMLGYSIYPPFMGMVDGLHPKRLLEE